MFHWILNTGFSLLHNAVPLLLNIRLAQVYPWWEVSKSTFPFFTKVCPVWPSLVKFCPLRPSVVKKRLRALHFLPCFLLLLGELLRSTETKYLELTQDSKYWYSLQNESIFKRITSGPWGEPKKSISPPAPAEPPGFLQRWWSEMLEAVVVQSCPQWNQFMNATFM